MVWYGMVWDGIELLVVVVVDKVDRQVFRMLLWWSLPVRGTGIIIRRRTRDILSSRRA